MHYEFFSNINLLSQYSLWIYLEIRINLRIEKHIKNVNLLLENQNEDIFWLMCLKNSKLIGNLI